MVCRLALGLGRLDGGALGNGSKPSRQPWPTNAPILMGKAQVQIAKSAGHRDLANGHLVRRKTVGVCLQRLKPGTDGFILTKYEDIAMVVRDPIRFRPGMSVAIDELVEQKVDPEAVPMINAMTASIVTLRPNVELWRAHRQELTDPWVGPGAARHPPASCAAFP